MTSDEALQKAEEQLSKASAAMAGAYTAANFEAAHTYRALAQAWMELAERLP